jgi:hypothetical protein
MQSGPNRNYLLELYTSEGCSSCPPAEAWVSSLRQSSRLWQEVVPITFHINYWDDLGWKDPLATQAFTDRQRNYAAVWNAENVYTPEFVLNSKEWRGRSLDAIPRSIEDAGILSAMLNDNGDLRVTFKPASGKQGPWEVHVALLGLDLSSNVRAGENSGRTLTHDFVAETLTSADMEGALPTAILHLAENKIVADKSALAVWVTARGELDPVQTVGGYL